MQRRSSSTASGAPSTVTPLGSSGPSRFHTQRNTAAGGPLTDTSIRLSPAPSSTGNSLGPVRTCHAAPNRRDRLACTKFGIDPVDHRLVGHPPNPEADSLVRAVPGAGGILRLAGGEFLPQR